MEYNREVLVKRYNEGEQLEYVLFWGHTEKTGELTQACLSQWYPCKFVVDDVEYHTTEQYMMAQKALLFQDKETYEKIMKANNPHDYKALGRTVQGFESKTWDAQKRNIVRQGNIAKFSQNNRLKDFLICTGEKILVEASPYDKIWGVRLSRENPEILNPNLWKGENLLGFILMEVREELKENGRN